MNSWNSDEILIHVGLPKAASTTLQKHLFCKLNNVQNFGLYPTNNVAGNNEPADSVDNAVYLKEPKLYAFYKKLHNDPTIDISELVSFWASIYEEHRDKRYDKILLSHEALTAPFFTSLTQEEKAMRLSKIFPGAKILLITRDQEDWFRSQYRDHPFMPTNLTLGEPVSFNEWMGCLLGEDSLAYVLEALNYKRLAGIYSRCFGSDNLYIVSFEDFVNQKENFKKVMNDFLGEGGKIINKLHEAKENQGLSFQYNLLRKLQRKKQKGKIINLLIDLLLRINVLKYLPKDKAPLSENLSKKIARIYR